MKTGRSSGCFKAFLIPILFFMSFAGCARDSSITEDFILMDTFVRVTIWGAREALAEKALGEAVERMKTLEAEFNYFAGTGELSAINGLKKGESLALSEEMFTVLKSARTLSERTGGTFDVTAKAFAEAGVTGNETWSLHEPAKKFTFNADGVRINLGGIAKGFIVDEGIAVLRGHGISNALIDAGGDMFCMGLGPGATGWKIGIQDPANPKKLVATFLVRDMAVATSGGYERFTPTEKGVFSHIVDPRSGRPVEERTKSVTVVAGNCMEADGLATALYVLEPEEGVVLIEDIDGAECLIFKSDRSFHASSGFHFGLTKQAQ